MPQGSAKEATVSRWLSSNWPLAVLVTICIGLIWAYATAVPIFEGFDAQAHYAAINYYRRTWTLPPITAETTQSSYEVVVHPPLYYVLAALPGTAWPTEGAAEFARRSVNVFWDESMSRRQSVTLPDAPWRLVAPAWGARLVSALGALITLLCTWWLARRVFPTVPTLAIAAAAIAAFNPQLLFMAVTISNDAWTAGMAALALAVAVDVTTTRRASWRWALVGVATGLAALTKYSALLLLLPVGILWILDWRRRGGGHALRTAGWGSVGFGVVAGWYFLRNVWLYGQPVPMAALAAALPSLYRTEPYSLAQTLELVPWLIASFWGVFVGTIAPGGYLDATRWFLGIGLAGCGVALIRLRRQSPTSALLGFVLLPWLAAVALSVLYWTRTVDYGEQGRLALIGASALGVVLAAGWQAWTPSRWWPAVHLALAGFMVTIAAAMAFFLHDAFALPAPLAGPPAPARPLDVRFAGGMRLLGADFPAGATLTPGDPLPVTLYFTTDAAIPEDYTLFLHLAGADNRLLYRFDGVPSGGRHPTRQWLPGQVFADSHTIQVDDMPAGELATLTAGYYPFGEKAQRLDVFDAAGHPIGDRVILGTVRLTDRPASGEMLAQPPVARWQGDIVLADAQLLADPAGLPAGVALEWQAAAPIQRDYTVFVQVLDAQNNILAQADSQPQAGNWPTSTWRRGERVADEVRWHDATGDMSTWQRVIVGLYDAGGVRLSLQDPAGGDDAVTIATGGGDSP